MVSRREATPKLNIVIQRLLEVTTSETVAGAPMAYEWETSRTFQPTLPGQWRRMGNTRLEVDPTDSAGAVLPDGIATLPIDVVVSIGGRAAETVSLLAYLTPADADQFDSFRGSAYYLDFASGTLPFGASGTLTVSLPGVPMLVETTQAFGDVRARRFDPRASDNLVSAAGRYVGYQSRRFLVRPSDPPWTTAERFTSDGLTYLVEGIQRNTDSGKMLELWCSSVAGE